MTNFSMPINNDNWADNKPAQRGSDIDDCRFGPVRGLEADDIIRLNTGFVKTTGKGKRIIINAFI